MKHTKKERKTHRFLFKSENARAVKDYIETESYINGVFDESGQQVIRGLNEEEKEFMNRFNANEYCGHFFGDGEDFYQTHGEIREKWNEKYMRRCDVMNNCKATYMLKEYDDTMYAKYLGDRNLVYEEIKEDEDENGTV